MKKTYNINISGYGFIIDEDAYQLLDSYLNTLSEICKKNSEEETAADIEQRIAEIFADQAENSDIKIISLKDVEGVIERMGSPEDILDTDTCMKSDASEAVSPPIFTASLPIKKKLYRDLNDKVLGGVCSGLGWYLGIDPVWIRVLTVVGIFLSASWLIWLYIILWIVIPAAKTPLQRMQMMGMNASMQNVGRVVTGRYTVTDPGIAENTGHKSNRIGRIIMMICAIVAVFIVGSLLIATGVALIGCILGLCISPLGGISDHSTQIRLILGCIAGGTLVVGIPLFLLFRLLLGVVVNKHLPALTIFQYVTLLVLWVIGIGAVLTCGILLHNMHLFS